MQSFIDLNALTLAVDPSGRLQSGAAPVVRLHPGLVHPRRDPDAFVLRWTIDGVRCPDYLRWIWHPITGDFCCGYAPIAPHHLYLAPKPVEQPWGTWLRGFWFRRERVIAARPYDGAHLDPYGPPDRDLDRMVTEAAFDMLRPLMRGVKMVAGVDNAWLVRHFGRYCDRW